MGPEDGRAQVRTKEQSQKPAVQESHRQEKRGPSRRTETGAALEVQSLVVIRRSAATTP